jgi:CelD/BcsL family acetyltransferase involved in cellulose biosynthesis
VLPGSARNRGSVGGATSASTPIPVAELTSRDVAAWRELAAQAAEPNPFFEPEFVLPAARHLGESHVGLLVVRGHDAQWLAAMPVRSRVRLRRARVPALSGWRHLYAFLGTPLVARSDVEHATERLLDQALHASRFGVIVLPWLGDDGPVVAALLAALKARGRHPALHRAFERAVLHREAVASGTDELVSPRHRRDFRRTERRLAEELDGDLALRDVSDTDAGVEQFLALEASGWKGERGTAMASLPGHADFFRELCAGFRTAGRLQLLAYGSAEQIVSAQCNVLTPEAVFHFKIAFDESFGRYKPGFQLELKMIELFRTQMSQSWIDSCADPDSQQFARLREGRRPIGSYVIAASRAVTWTIDHGVARFAGESTA